jgi:hypothetical protein
LKFNLPYQNSVIFPSPIAAPWTSVAAWADGGSHDSDGSRFASGGLVIILFKPLIEGYRPFYFGK